MFFGVFVPFADNNHLSVLIVFRLQKYRVLFLFYHEDKKIVCIFACLIFSRMVERAYLSYQVLHKFLGSLLSN